MRAVIQRVQYASVSIGGAIKNRIGEGLLLLIGIEDSDRQEDIDFLVKKIINLRIFDDKEGVMNLSIRDIDGDILSISQFTLHASTKKGNRPSYIKAAKPDIAIPIYDKFNSCLADVLDKPVRTGEFGANMQVELLNDGPVTIVIDSKKKE